MDTVLELAQYSLIYKVSHLTLFSAAYAAYRGHYTLVPLPSSIFLSSILYWYYPTYGWRRTLDMLTVKTAFAIQHALVYKYQYAVPYYVISGLGFTSYLLGYYYRDQLWLSTYFHIGVHILCNMAVLVLYTSKAEI